MAYTLKGKMQNCHFQKITEEIPYITLSLVIFLRQNTKSKIHKRTNTSENFTLISWTSLKLNFCSVKDTIKRMKRQTTDWEKIFVKHVPYKELICNIYKKLIKLNSKKRNNLKIIMYVNYIFQLVVIKMEEYSDLWFKQHAVIELLTVGKVPAIEIHRWMQVFMVIRVLM